MYFPDFRKKGQREKKCTILSLTTHRNVNSYNSQNPSYAFKTESINSRFPMAVINLNHFLPLLLSLFASNIRADGVDAAATSAEPSANLFFYQFSCNRLQVIHGSAAKMHCIEMREKESEKTRYPRRFASENFLPWRHWFAFK